MSKRIFIPGSKYLYFKLYTGYKSADNILAYGITSYIKKMITDNCIDNFFFIRYSDPDFHLRLRLLISNKGNYGHVLTEFYNHFEPIVDKGLITNVLCDTYIREIERYGDKTIDLVERIFHMDSTCIINILSILANIDDVDNEHLRWQLSLLLIDDLMEAWGVDLYKKVEFMSELAISFKKEFSFTSNTFTKQINDKYRKYRDNIDKTMERDSGPISPFLQSLSKRKDEVADIFKVLMPLLDKNILPLSEENMMTSLIHMTMNRWFRSKNRLNEMVIYEFLSRHYSSKAAKQKYAANK